MSRIANFLLAACVAGLPIAAQAQPGSPMDDRAYCAKLSELYVRYIGHDNSNANNFLRRGANDAQVASTQCQVNTAWAIPVLEQQLAANKFTLPPRD
jgi:hypothetical protein